MIKTTLNKTTLIKAILCAGLGAYLLKHKYIYINTLIPASMFILPCVYCIIRLILAEQINRIISVIKIKKYINAYIYFIFILTVTRLSIMLACIFKLFKLISPKIYDFIIREYNKYKADKDEDYSVPVIYIIYCNIKKFILNSEI